MFEKNWQSLAMKDFWKEIFSSGTPDFYVHPGGEYVIFNTDHQYHIFSGKDGEAMLSGEYMPKSGKKMSLGASLLAGSNPLASNMAESISLSEGSGFYLFEDENVALFLDWTFDTNRIMAYDLNTFEKLWETEDYRFSLKKNAQVLQSLMGAATARSARFPMYSITPAALTGQLLMSEMYTQMQYYGYGTSSAMAYITHLQNKGTFLLKANEELICLDIRTGEEKWRKTEDITIGYDYTLPNEDAVVLINFNASFLKNNDKKIIKLNTNTGETLWEAEHVGMFHYERNYVSNNRLILDYNGIEMYNLETGEKMLMSRDEKKVKQSNTLSAGLLNAGDGTGTDAPDWWESLVTDEHVYTMVTEDLSDAGIVVGGMDIFVHKYDLATGELVWKSEALHESARIINVTNGNVVTSRSKAFGNRFYAILSDKDGTIIRETDVIKDYFGDRPKAGIAFTDQSAYFGGKKGIYVFNLNTWENTKTFDVKDAKIGKLQGMSPTRQGLMTIGDKGVGFYNQTGDFEESQRIKRVSGAFWDGTYCYVFNPKGTSAVSMTGYNEVDDLPFTPDNGDELYFSSNGQHVIVISGKSIMTKYSIN